MVLASSEEGGKGGCDPWALAAARYRFFLSKTQTQNPKPLLQHCQDGIALRRRSASAAFVLAPKKLISFLALGINYHNDSDNSNTTTTNNNNHINNYNNYCYFYYYNNNNNTESTPSTPTPRPLPPRHRRSRVGWPHACNCGGNPELEIDAAVFK